MEHLEIIAEGRVQGVGYRQYVLNRARKCEITGWVKNLANGNVMIHAQGEEKNMVTFLNYLRSGPSLSRVLNLKISQFKGIANFTTFEIRY